MEINNNTQNIAKIVETGENTSETNIITVEYSDILSEFRTYIIENIPFEELMLYLSFIAITGSNVELIEYDEINKELTRRPNYYYNSDTINLLLYKMNTTNRDHFIKTILIRNFDKDQDTFEMTRFYDNTKATLFVSGHQLNKKNIKFTQVGINEDNDKHKYKTFAELLATIRFVIEQTIGATVWIYIEPQTLLPSIHVCKYNNKKHKWIFDEQLTNFETNVSIGYVGINMYNISSENTVKAVKQRYYEFMDIINDSISSQVNETVHTLPEVKQMINFLGDKIVIDNRFCFYYTISHKTISPLIRYLINYLDLDINALNEGTVNINHDGVDNYLKYTFDKTNFYVHGQTLNKDWKCDFGIVTDCHIQNDDRDKTMLLDCLPTINMNAFNSFDIVSYLYAKRYPDILINFVLARHPHTTYGDIIGLMNVYNLLYEIISFDSIWINDLESNREFKIWDLILYMYTKNYKEQLISMIKSSHYVKLTLLSIDCFEYCTESRMEVVFNTMLHSKQPLTFEEAYKLVYRTPGYNEINDYWSMILDLLRLIGPDFTNDELRLNKKLLFKMIDKECEC